MDIIIGYIIGVYSVSGREHCFCLFGHRLRFGSADVQHSIFYALGKCNIHVDVLCNTRIHF